MAGLDAETIESLISCEKRITDPPRKESQLKNRSYRNDMKVSSTDMKHDFSVFLRQSDDFPDDFSIGLNYVDENGKIYMLIRCNGPHGPSVTDYLKDEPHYGYHIHRLLPFTNGMSSELTVSYGTFQDAIAHFCKKCNITDADEYFAFLRNNNQLQLDMGI